VWRRWLSAGSTAKARYFRSAAEFRRWLERNHAGESEITVGFYKKGSGKKSITFREALDEALCFGWIDGVRHSVDDERYVNRFTPRTPRSYWSAVNIARVWELNAEGRMHAAGRRAFGWRDEQRAQADASLRAKPEFSREETVRFRKNRAAWSFWESLPPGFRRNATWWVVSAKRDETRKRRLATLIEHSARGERIAVLTPPRARRPS
jgi:uncharacterized protein YdeI (YjbR/CyaY-like superfamily)